MTAPGDAAIPPADWRTLQTRTEQSLAWHAAVLRLLPLPLLMTGSQGELREANDAGRHLVEAAGLRAAGLLVWDLAADAEGRSAIFEAVRAAAAGAPQAIERIALRGAGDAPVGARLRVLPLPPDPARGREAPALVLLVEDRSSELRHAAAREQSHEESERRAAIDGASAGRSEVLARLGHELRTPLNAIVGFGQLLARDAALPVHLAPQVERVLASAQQLAKLVDQVLEFNRLEAGAAVLRPQPMLVQPVLRHVAGLVRPLAERRQMRLEVEDPADGGPGPRALADPESVAQIVNNLLTNAVKYGQAGGRIRIAVERDAGEVRVTVRDSGSGLTPAQLRALFQPLDRLGQEHSPTPGSGLGLSIAQRVARAMNGRIDASSAPGQGCVFTLVLPRFHE